MSNLRSIARELAIEQVSAAASKEHEPNYGKLHIYRDGSVRWTEHINQFDHIIDGEAEYLCAIPSVACVGTGSYSCNCEYCEAVFCQRGEDDVADLADEVDEDAREAARKEYRDEHGYGSEAEAINAAVADSDLDRREAVMLAEFDAIGTRYFDDEEDQEDE